MFNYILLPSFYYITLVTIETFLNAENLDSVLYVTLLPIKHFCEIPGLVFWCHHLLENNIEPLDFIYVY